MKLDGANKETLRELYEAKLRNAEKVPAHFSPSKHRSTQIDVEKTLQGTSDVPTRPVHSPSRSRGSASPSSAGRLHSRAASGRRSATNKATVTAADLEPPAASLYKTDYCAHDSDAHHVAQLTATKLALETTSEWAMLNQLERSMVEKEEAAREAAKKQHQHQQRQQLDQQVSEHERARQAVVAAKAAELAATNADVEAYKAEEAQRAAAAEAAAEKLKAEREKQSAAAEAAHKRQAAKKDREEAALLKSIQRQMTEAQEAAAAKAAQAKAAAEEAKRANVEAKQAKQQAAKEQQQRDEALMRGTIKTLQKQEEAREAALKAFHDMIAARAEHAGAAAVAENKSRQEREERLIAASEAKAEAEAEAKHAAEVAKRAAMAADTRASAAAAAAAKVAAEQLRKQEQAGFRAEMEADLAQHQQLEAMTAEQRKAKNLKHRQALEAQIAEAEARQVLDDVFMVEKERQLNKRLLTHARNMLSTMSSTK